MNCLKKATRWVKQKLLEYRLERMERQRNRAVRHLLRSIVDDQILGVTIREAAAAALTSGRTDYKFMNEIIAMLDREVALLDVAEIFAGVTDEDNLAETAERLSEVS